MKPLSLFLLVWACASPVSALTLSLGEVAPRVRSHHPALKAARLAVEEARGRQLGAGRLANPSLGYDFQNQSAVSPRTGVISLDQSFPLTRRLSLEKKLAAQFVTAAGLEVADAERRFIAEAESMAVRLLTLSRQRQLREQQMELAQKLADFAQGRAEAGEVSPLDAKQVRLDAQKLRIESLMLEAESVALLGQLKPMLGLRSEEPLSLTGGLPALALPASSSWRQRPDYRLAQTHMEAAQTSRQLAKAKRLPDVTAGLFGAHEMQEVTSSQRERTGFIGFRVSIPLPFWNRNQGEIAEKAASAERARLEAEALAALIHGEAGTARSEMETHASIVRETRDTLVPLAVRQSAEMEKAYESGQADLLSVLRSRDQRLQLESAVLDAERDFHLARIRYEAATSP